MDKLSTGTGLGLSIVAKLVTALGGEIRVSSERGSFSEFSVAFPFHEPPADVDGIGKRLSGATIFLVDDQGSESGGVFKQVSKILRFYQVDFIALVDKCLAEGSALSLSPERSYICLTSEDVFDQDSYVCLRMSVKRSALELSGRSTLSPRIIGILDIKIRCFLPF